MFYYFDFDVFEVVNDFDFDVLEVLHYFDLAARVLKDMQIFVGWKSKESGIQYLILK